MKSLIIIANPKPESFSFAIVNRYKELAEAKNHEVEIIDLYRTTHQQPFFTYQDANNLDSNPAMKYFQDKISWADELVFVFPYWWGSMPAILKNFFDWNLSRGFAFKYVNSRPVGLLTDKTVKIFTTTGAPSIYYTLIGANSRLRKMFKQQIIEFCGMKLSECNIYGGVDSTKTDMDKILAKVSFR
jgi:NAD(P)H dehydrogenase (quinone)